MAQQGKKSSGLPQAPGQIPSTNFNFRQFSGVNTQAARQGIQDIGEFSWLENIMPIGFGNAKVVQAVSDSIATLTGESVYYMKGYNISNVPYMFAAATSGAAYQINLNTNAVTTIAPAATFPPSGTQIAQWKNERILIINSTNYFDWNGTSLTVLGGTTSAPTAGQCIATYAGRVWISQNRTINYSAAASYTSFAGSGGNTIITDQTLTSDITQLLSANNFLYFFGLDSINVIADVQVVAGTTQFSNTNISANSGTGLAQTIFPYFRSIWYMNEGGVYALYGATPRKASDALDGVFPLIDFTEPVTGGTVMIYNQLCAAFQFTYDDPMSGARPLMAIYFNKKWYFASQLDGLSLIATAQSGNDTLIGTDGESLYTLFDDPEAEIPWLLRTALWDFGDMTRLKSSLALGIEANLTPGVGDINPTVDTESNSTVPVANFSGSTEFQWVNGSGADFTWINGAMQTFVWFTVGYAWFQGDVETSGHYLGVTINSTAPQLQIIGIQLKYRMEASNWGE